MMKRILQIWDFIFSFTASSTTNLLWQFICSLFCMKLSWMWKQQWWICANSTLSPLSANSQFRQCISLAWLSGSNFYYNLHEKQVAQHQWLGDVFYFICAKIICNEEKQKKDELWMWKWHDKRLCTAILPWLKAHKPLKYVTILEKGDLSNNVSYWHRRRWRRGRNKTENEIENSHKIEWALVLMQDMPKPSWRM